MWIHPLWQTATIFLGWYVFYTGWKRFETNSLGIQKPFQWKLHVSIGKASLYMWIYGAAVGAAAAWVKWRAFGITGIHFLLGAAIVILALFGYWSGLHMDVHKKRRKILPLIHGSNNFVLLLLSMISLVTGIEAMIRLL